MKDFKIYLFDFDGTLVDTVDSLSYVFIEAFRDCGIKCDESEVLGFIRQPLDKTWYDKGGTVEEWEKYKDRILFYLDEEKTLLRSKVFEDVRKVLNTLKDNGKILGIVTSNTTIHAKQVCKFLNIDQNLFGTIVGSDTVEGTKPDPRPVLKAIELLNLDVANEDIVYIGDSKNDTLAGKNAGISHILLDRLHEYDSYTDPKIYTLMELINE